MQEAQKPKHPLRARPSVRDKVDFFNETANRVASTSRERTSRTPTRQASEEWMTRTPPLSYAASSGQASSELDRNFRSDSDDDAGSDLRSVPSLPSLPSYAQRPSQSSEQPPPPSTAPPAVPQHTTTTVTSIRTSVSPIQYSPMPPSPKAKLPIREEPSEDADSPTPPLQLDRTPGLLLIANTPKGRAVKASRRIPSRTVIEVCPVLVLDPAEVQSHFQHTFLHNYTYNWPWKDAQSGRTLQSQALPLGLGSLFNHSNHLWKCNVGWTRSTSNVPPVATPLNGLTLPTNGAAVSFNSLDSFATTDTNTSSSDPAARDRRQVAGNDSITYTTLRDIEPGEELCISYGPAGRLTFVDIEAEREAREAAEAARREREDEELASYGARTAPADEEARADAVISPVSPLENLWVDVDALDIYSRIDEEHGVGAR